MPLLTPFAVDCPTSLSKTALHIAHCAFTLAEYNIRTIIRDALFTI